MNNQNNGQNRAGNNAQNNGQNAQNNQNNPAPAAGGGQPNRYLPRLHDLFPKLFTGRGDCNPHAHWLKWLDYCTAHGLNNQQRIDQFLFTLDMDAREWIADHQFQNPVELRDSFVGYFSGFGSREARLEAFRACKWDPVEKVDKYASKLRRLAAQLNIDNDLLKDQFMQGLPFEMRQFIVMSGVNDLNGLVRLAQRFADIQKEKLPSVPQVSFSVQEAMHCKLEGLMDCVKQMAITQQQYMAFQQARAEERPSRFDSYQSRSRQDSRSRSRDRRDKRDRRDRTERRDRSASRDNSRTRNKSPYPGKSRSKSPARDLACHFCGSYGHTWKRCFKLEEQIRSGKLKDF